jgi:hypothetical protein
VGDRRADQPAADHDRIAPGHPLIMGPGMADQKPEDTG